VGGEFHWGAAYVGTRPTFDNGLPLLEVFLFDFAGDLYGREIEVEFIDHIRGDRRFDGVESLRAQIARDCERAREILAAVEGHDPLAGLPLAGALARGRGVPATPGKDPGSPR
jgi:riboflavin kinase/FMN adenylyltransferase